MHAFCLNKYAENNFMPQHNKKKQQSEYWIRYDV